MELLLGLSALATIATGTFVGARLLRLARITRQLPELMAGTGLLGFAAVGYPLMLVVVLAPEAIGSDAIRIVLACALLAYTFTLATLAVFTQCTFRPGSGWAHALAAGIGLLAAVGAGIVLACFDFDALVADTSPRGTRIGMGLMSVGFAAVFGWTGLESLRYHGRMRRRLRLGLADPAVVDRFRIWGLGTSTAAGLTLATLALTVAGITVANSALPPLLQALSGLVSSATWYLTFTPPKRYLERVRRQGLAAAA